MRRAAGFFAVLMLILISSGCGSADRQERSAELPTAVPIATERAEEELKILTKNKINGEIVLTNGDKIAIELYPGLAPKTVQNFISLADSGFYDGTIFHRAIDGFVVHGGGYTAELEPKPAAAKISGEFSANGVSNELKHERGVISMARISGDNDSASSQFFIVLDSQPSLDGQYAAFGRVSYGMDVLDNIAICDKADDPPEGMEDLPAELYEIQSVVIEK